MGPSVYTPKTDAFFRTRPADADAPKFEPPTTGVALAREVAADRPSGTVAFTGARS
jgi:hypothetical protein